MPGPDDRESKSTEIAGRAVVIVFGIAFGGIGLAVIGFLWTSSGFGEPPTFFKVFGTLVALPFIAFGAMILIGGLGLAKFPPRPSLGSLAERLKAMRNELGSDLPDAPTEKAASPTSYTCPHCGAPLGTSTSASPHGDVKCTHCETWFNIYGK